MSSEPQTSLDDPDATAQVTLPKSTNESEVNFDLSGIKRIVGQAASSSTVVPAADDEHVLNEDSIFKNDQLFFDGQWIDDKTIQNIQENSIRYTPAVGEWLLEHDDIVPSILSMFEGLVMGSEGLMVEPADPDNESDVDAVEYMEDLYEDTAPDPDRIDPPDVIRQILMDNTRYAVSVLRADDLAPVAISSLDVVTDGETGETMYVQEPMSYETYDIGANGALERNTKSTDEQVLRRGEHVYDAELYRTAPLRAVADDIVNKLQLKRFKARMAEVSSIGGIYIKVNPPAWLPEDMYFEKVAADDHEYGDTSAYKLEIAVQRDIDAALKTLQRYQSATIMSIPEHWEVDTVELPQMEESFDEMIAGYNENISRRMLLPFDLMDLAEKGQMLSAAVASWQREIARVFDQFGQRKLSQRGQGGSVIHRFPSLEVEDEKLLIRSLAYSGLLGLSQSEARSIVNSLEGVDLDEDVEGREMPPLGDLNPEQKEQMGREALDLPGSPEGTEDVTPPSAMDPEIPKDEGDEEIEAASSYSEGDVVSYDDGKTGVVLEKITEEIEWPGGDETTTVQASTDDPMYVVARESSGSGLYSPDELSSGSFPSGLEADPEELAAAKPAQIYAFLDDPSQINELMAANIPGVDDPEIGFSSYPPNWDRMSLLKFWSTVGGSWRSCQADMVEYFGPNGSKKFCSAAKDELYGTEKWRGGWG